MTQASKSAGGPAASGSAAESGLQAGAQAFRDLLARIRAFSDEAIGNGADEDTRDYRAMAKEVTTALGAHLHDHPDGEHREGFLSTLTSLLCMTADGCMPRAGALLVAEAIDLYMAHYAGRDSTRVQRLT